PRSVEDSLHRDEPNLQRIPVMNRDRGARRYALIVDVRPVDRPHFFEHAVFVVALDDLGVAARDGAVRIHGGEIDVGENAGDWIGATNGRLVAAAEEERGAAGDIDEAVAHG